MKSKNNTCEVTNLPIEYCAHCKTKKQAQNTHEAFAYSLKETSFHGLPIIELLYRGGPIHEYDQNFRFGIEKAQLLMMSIQEIEGFAFKERGYYVRQTTKKKLFNDFRIILEYHPSFVNSFGSTIEQPFINLKKGDIHIGIGLKKAKAICYLEEQIKEWLKRHLKNSL